MRAPHTTFVKVARAAAIAVALGAAAITAMPAQAAGPSFSFGFGMGPGFYPHHGYDYYDDDYYNRRPFFPHFVCYTDFQVRRAIANAGYYNVHLNAPMGRY